MYVYIFSGLLHSTPTQGGTRQKDRRVSGCVGSPPRKYEGSRGLQCVEAVQGGVGVDVSCASPVASSGAVRTSNTSHAQTHTHTHTQSLHDVLKAKDSELSHLSSLLARQAEEKRSIEQHRYKLAAENLDLRGQVQEMRTSNISRHRPSSALSAASRSWWPPQPSHLQQGGSVDMHTIREHKHLQLGGSALSQRPPSTHMRPASASYHNYRVAPGQQAARTDMVPRHAVFGHDSLLHRSVYAPTQVISDVDETTQLAEGGVARRGHSPPKDQLFLRAEAYRTLRGPGARGTSGNSRASSGVSAHRSRPQSANAAIRHLNARELSGGVVRPGSARARSSYAEQLIHSDADDFVHFHVAAGSEDLTQHAIRILALMRSAAGKKYIRVVDFMSSFDKLKRGHISCAEFRRSLESCACFGEVSEEEYNLVFSFFLHESTACTNVLSPTSRLSYSAFCEVLQPVGDKRVKLNVDQEVLKQLGQLKPTALDAARQHSSAAAPSPESETQLRTLVGRILEVLREDSISIGEFLARLDSRRYPGSGPTTPSASNSTGCMSRSQYLRVRERERIRE